MRIRNWLLLSPLVWFGLAGSALQTAHGQNNAIWIGGAGFWGESSHWSSHPAVPNGDQFGVAIDSGNAVASTVTVGENQTFAVGNLEIDGDDSLRIDLGSSLTVGKSTSSTLTNRGRIDVNGGALTIRNEVTLNGGGIVRVDFGPGPTGTGSIQSATTSVGHLINVDNAIVGTGTFGSGDLDFTNQAGGVLDPGGPTPNSTWPVGWLRFEGRNVINRGQIRTSTQSVLNLGAVDIDNTGGLIEAIDQSGISILAESVHGGVLRTADSGEIYIENGTKLSDLTIDGTIRSQRIWSISGAIDNRGTINVETFSLASSGLNVDTEVTLSGGGVVNLLGPSAYFRSGVVINRDNTIQVNGRGGIYHPLDEIANEANGTLSANHKDCLFQVFGFVGNANHGTVLASNGGVMSLAFGVDNFGTLYAGLDSEIRSSYGSLTNADGGLMIGTGTISSEIGIDNFGRIAPGASVGHLTIEAPLLSFGETSLLDIEIDGSGADLLTVFGDLFLDGELQVSLLAGFTPDASSNFQIIAVEDFETGVTATLSGTFSGIADGERVLTADGRGSFIVDYTDDGVYLTNYTAVPEPAAASIMFISLASLSAARRQRRVRR